MGGPGLTVPHTDITGTRSPHHREPFRRGAVPSGRLAWGKFDPDHTLGRGWVGAADGSLTPKRGGGGRMAPKHQDGQRCCEGVWVCGAATRRAEGAVTTDACAAHHTAGLHPAAATRAV